MMKTLSYLFLNLHDFGMVRLALTLAGVNLCFCSTKLYIMLILNKTLNFMPTPIKMSNCILYHVCNRQRLVI